MNYVGSISIIDRGDAPAKAIIDKNTRSLAQRVADETKEELDKVMDRVDNIYVSYEMSTQTMFENPRGSPNVEYIEDIKELEEILTDTVKKKKYQQQVTVFVVGFQDVCSQKMQLLQQVNQFFLDNSKLDEDELTEDKPEIDLEEASNKVNESLSTAEELAKKLSDLNQDIIEWLVNYANTKASNKGKKRLEKNLESAKNELTDLSEKLLKLQTELEEKDEKFQQVAKQLEAKSQEAVRYKTAAEVAKKSAQDNEAHTSVLQDEITRRDEKIVELRTKLSRLEINLTESQFDKEMSTRRLDNAQAQTKEKLAKLQEEVDSQRIAVSDAEREMEKLHKEQLTSMHKAHQQEIEELKKEHEEEIAKLTDELLTLQDQVKFAEQQALEATGMSEDLRAKLFELELGEPTKDNIDDPISRQSSANLSGKSIGELSASEEEQPSRQDSRQSNKDTKKKSETLKPTKAPSKSPNRITKDKSGKTTKDFADVSVQDEGGDAAKAYVEKANEASRQAAKSKNLEPVVEGDGSEFPNAFDLDDEDSWASVPPQHVAGRFLQFRQLGRAKIKELEEQLQVTLTKTHRKVNSLKSQFSEHKYKWEAERKVLIEQVEQAQKLQTDAEKEADAAMTQLEEFINEQEKLEDEEEQKRQEIIKTMSRPGTVKQSSPPPAEQKPQEIKPDEQGDRLQTENSEQELKNLMQQTDDAKSRAGSSVGQSVVDGSPVAPWLTPAYLKGEIKYKESVVSDPNAESQIDDLQSRLTSVADAEIQKILPIEDGSDTKMSNLTVAKLKEEANDPIDGVKGEKERLMSRTSSKASKKPKIKSPSHLSEQEEDGESEDEDLAPWLKNWGEPKIQSFLLTGTVDEDKKSSRLSVSETVEGERKLSSKSVSGSVMDSKRESGEISGSVLDTKRESSEIRNEVVSQKSQISDEVGRNENITPWFHNLGKPKVEAPNPPESATLRPTRTDTREDANDIIDIVKQENIKVEKQDSSNERKKQTIPQKKLDLEADKKKLYAAYRKKKAAEEKKKQVSKPKEKEKELVERSRRTSSAKIPKELQNKLNKELDKVRRIKSSFGYVDEMDSPVMSEEENERDGVEAETDEPVERRDIYPERRDIYPERRSAVREDDSIPELKSRTATQSRAPSRNTIQNSRMTQQSLKSVSLAMELGIDGNDEDDDNFENKNQENSVEMQSSIKGDQAHDIKNDSQRSTGQSPASGRQQRLRGRVYVSEHVDPASTGENIRDEMLVSSRGMMTDEEKVNQSRTSMSRDLSLTDKLLESNEQVTVIPDCIINMAAQKNARQTGAISAPPAVEPNDSQAQKFENFEEDFESKPVTSREKKTPDNQSHLDLNNQKPVSPPKEAFKTPRSVRSESLHSEVKKDSHNIEADLGETVAIDADVDKRVDVGKVEDEGQSDSIHQVEYLNVQKTVSPPREASKLPRSGQSRSLHSEMSDDSVSIDNYPEEDIAVSKSQSADKENLKSVLAADKLTLEQQKTFESLKSVIKSLSEEQALRDMQLERTVSILSLASQIAQESVEQGVLPDTFLDRFSKMGSRGMSRPRSCQRSIKGSALSKVNDKAPADDEDKLDTDMEVSSVKQLESKPSSQLRSAVSQKSLENKQKKDKEIKEMIGDKKSAKAKEKVSEAVDEFSFSGSVAADYLSSRGDSFSASLPRTMTSSEWRRFSPHDPFSPNAEKKEKQRELINEAKAKEKKEKSEQEFKIKSGSGLSGKDLPYEDLQGAETKMSTISVVISPRKKSRPVTMEKMLYGEGSLDVVPSGLETSMGIMKDEKTPQSRSTQRSRLPSEKNSSVSSQRSDIECKTNTIIVTEENDHDSVSKLKPNQLNSDLLIHEQQENNVDGSQKVEKSKNLLPTTSGLTISTKFKCMTKVLTLEIKTKQKHRSKSFSNTTKAPSKADTIDLVTGDCRYHDIDRLTIKGTNHSHHRKDHDVEILKKNQHQSRSLSLVGFPKSASRSLSLEGFSKSVSRSNSFAIGKSVSKKWSVSSRLALLANRKKYHVGLSEFGDITKLAETKNDNKNQKAPVDYMFPPNWKFKNEVAEGFPHKFSYLQNRDVREVNETELECYGEPVPGEQTSKSSDQSRQSSTSSQMAASFSAKSKRSTQKSEHSSLSEIQQPKSPSTLDRVSPVTINRTSPVTINRSPRTSATPGTMVSDVQRPVSISSVQPKICDSPPPDLHKFHPLQFHKETQTEDMLSQIEHEPVTGNTEEQVRQSSAKSRASLRNQFKSRLDETRQAVEDRRTKSPVIMVPTQKSVDDELIIEDDDDLPIPDDLKEEVFYREDTLDAGTSPPPAKQDVGRKISMASRKSTNLAEHPVVQEFLRAYTGIHNFKEAMSRVLVDKDQMSASQILSELDAIPFNKDNKVVPQVSTMTENIYYVLNEVSQVINSVLQNDRGPVVSSLMMGMSRDATQRTILREKSGVTVDAHPETRGSQRTVSTKAGSASTDMAQYQELQAQYEKLQNQMSEESKKYEEQQRHNVVVMMEMQDTINQLQRELSALGKQTRRPTSESMSAAGAQNADSAIMFTRLDSERNAKIMKKAVNEKKLDPNRYKEAMVQMDEYVNLPAQRLTHLVRKYVHHCRMKEIEENVQKSQSLNENVFELFDKMEELQNQRAKRWADRMDEMGIERYRLANMLMETLDSIEQESGLFLIKPMYSYRGREPKEQNYTGKITRPFRPHRTLSPLRDSSSAHAPAPTPASNVRARNQTRRDEMYQSQTSGQGQYEPKGPLEGDSTGLMGSSVGYMAGQSRSTWSMADSQIGMSNPMLGNVNTPRILELDINRMMIGQNTISAQIGSPGLSNDRLVNAANNNLRAYMTVNRPGPNSAGRADRPHSGSRQSPRPSSSPTNPSVSTAKRVRLSDVEIPTVLSSGQPLPPIGTTPDKPRSSSTKGSRSPPRIPVGNELPESPPGSSLRHSPPGMEDSEITSPVK